MCPYVSNIHLQATLSNRLNVTIPKNVYPAALNAGLPASSLKALVAALSGTGSYANVPASLPPSKPPSKNLTD